MKKKERRKKKKKRKRRKQNTFLSLALLPLSSKAKKMASSPPKHERDIVEEAQARAEKRNENQHSVPKGEKRSGAREERKRGDTGFVDRVTADDGERKTKKNSTSTT